MLHSYIYYELNDSLVSDDLWQAWAQELVSLQAEHPAPIDFFDDLFTNWDGTTGYHLTKNGWVKQKASYLMWHNPYVERKPYESFVS